jgi:hypothetical protein
VSHLATARWTTALLFIASSALPAQFAGAAGVGASLQREGGGLWQSLTRLEPSARLSNQWLQLDGSASFVSGAKRMDLEHGTLGFVAETPAWNRLRLSTTAHLERHAALAGFPDGGGTFEAALSYGGSGHGLWFGFASERTRQVLGASSNGNGDGLLRAGLWQQIGPVSLVLGSSQHQLRQTRLQLTPLLPDDSLSGPGDTAIYTQTTHTDVRHWSDTEVRMIWSIGRVAFDGRFGLQSRADSLDRWATWASATATMAMGSRLSLVGALGTRPAREWMGAPGQRFASLGVRIAPAALSRPPAPVHVQPTASRFAVRPSNDGLYVVTISVPSARTVELSGDFNSWRAVTLRETRPDVWETTIALAPGTYHVNMRVNGASWVAPPGLSQTTDDFNGSVGLLVVR